MRGAARGIPATRAWRRCGVPGVESLLVEGGGRLAGALLARGPGGPVLLGAEPALAGRRGVPAVAGLPSEPIARSWTRWRVVERRALGEDTLLVLDRR